jgi:putative oxidoreductase
MKKLFNTTASTFQVNISLLILRIGISALMLTHGWPKLMRLIQGGEISFPDPLGMGPTLSLVMATLAEFGGSILIILGLATRFASFSLAFTMFVAVFIVHAGDPFSKMEMGLIYLLVYIILMITGGGKYSLDKYIR